MRAQRRAQKTGLLSLPEDLLAKIALMCTYSKDGNGWNAAAKTCKRLWAVQLSSDPTFDSTSCKAFPPGCICLETLAQMRALILYNSEVLVYVARTDLQLTTVMSIVQSSAADRCNFCSCVGLKWRLRRFQHAKKIAFWIKSWPCWPNELQELSQSLLEVSCNLQKMKHLVRPLHCIPAQQTCVVR